MVLITVVISCLAGMDKDSPCAAPFIVPGLHFNSAAPKDPIYVSLCTFTSERRGRPKLRKELLEALRCLRLRNYARPRQTWFRREVGTP